MEEKSKLLFITGYFPFRQGGAEYQALLLAEQLKHQFTISFIFRNHWNKNKIIHDNEYTLFSIRPQRIKGTNNTFIFEARQLKSILRRVRPDIIYVRGANAYCTTAALYAQKHKCKIVWHIAHDRDLIPAQYKKTISNPFKLVEKKMVEYGLMHSHRIIGQTRQQAMLLRKNYTKKCDYIIGNWHPIPSNPNKKDSTINVLWIANWRPFKQPEIFIRLVQKIGDAPNTRFIMIGRNKEYPAIKANAIANNIETPGELPNFQVNEMLSKSHLLINTSQMEGFSNTFIQAWMRKVPVISLQVDPDKILQKTRMGFCSGNFEKLVQDTKLLLRNHDLREKMGKKSRDYALQHHSLANIEKIKHLFAK